MITDHDRSGWFGASDTAYIMGKWDTKTFAKWWMKKLGMDNDHFANAAMNAGTYYEHAILDAIGAPRKDHQILLPELRLRVNLDGDGKGEIFEVKTYGVDKEFKVPAKYRRQVQVQMYAKLREEGFLPRAHIVSYGLTEDDYRNFFNPVDMQRLNRHPIDYDEVFICQYLQRLRYLAKCLEEGSMPCMNLQVNCKIYPFPT